MHPTPFFSDLRKAYEAELHDLSFDSDGKHVLKKHLAERRPQLTQIVLTYCYKLTDEAVKHLAEHCPQLIYVNLVCCDKITDISLDKLGEGCRKLTFVDISGCPHITQTASDRLQQRLPDVHIKIN
jgi:hypothetical protein